MLQLYNMILTVLVAFLMKGSFANDIAKEIDMFKEVGLLKQPLPQGVTSVQAKDRNSPAFRFTTQVKNLVANQNAYDKANRLIHDSHDFWISAWFKLDPKAVSDNTVVSVSSGNGNQLYFKLKISGDYVKRRGVDVEVLVNTGSDPERFEAKHTTLDYTQWHKVAVRIQDGERLIRIYISNMQKPAKVYLLDGIAPFPVGAELRLAQEKSKGGEDQIIIQDKFKGDLQDVKFTRGSFNDCPPLTTCRCSDVPQQKKCTMDGLRYDDGARWTKNNCTICKCEFGQAICTYTCKVCVDDGRQYLQGETWKLSNNTCYNCRCQDGQSECSPTSCPILNCKSGKSTTPLGECCPICKEDFCARTKKVYKTCGCDKTCDNISNPCSPCTEGCFCLDGQIKKNGKCKANANCPCTYKGNKYEFGSYYLGSCTFGFCSSGKMNEKKFC